MTWFVSWRHCMVHFGFRKFNWTEIVIRMIWTKYRCAHDFNFFLSVSHTVFRFAIYDSFSNVKCERKLVTREEKVGRLSVSNFSRPNLIQLFLYFSKRNLFVIIVSKARCRLISILNVAVQSKISLYRNMYEYIRKGTHKKHTAHTREFMCFWTISPSSWWHNFWFVIYMALQILCCVLFLCFLLCSL